MHILKSHNQEKRPVFDKMSDKEIQSYIVEYIKCRFLKNGRLIRKLPLDFRDDALQDIFIDLWKNRANYNPKIANFSTYAFNRGRGVIKDILTKNGRLPRLAKKLFAEDPKLEVPKNEVLENKEDIKKLFSKLNEQEIKILKMRFFEELSVQEISIAVKCSVQKVYQIISKIQKENK